MLTREGQRVHLYGDFGTIRVDHEPPEVRIRWDEGGSWGQVINPEWIHLTSLDLVTYPPEGQRFKILQELQRLRVLTAAEQHPTVTGLYIWGVRDISRTPLWVREMYVRTGAVTYREPSTKDDG